MLFLVWNTACKDFIVFVSHIMNKNESFLCFEEGYALAGKGSKSARDLLLLFRKLCFNVFSPFVIAITIKVSISS